MSLRKFLIVLGIGAGLSWLAFITVLYYIDPLTSGLVGIFCFYISLFFALVGTIALIGFFARFILKGNTQAPFRHIGISLRQSILFAVLVVGSFILQGNRLFVWWSMILLLIGLTILEIFFLMRDASKQTTMRIRRN